MLIQVGPRTDGRAEQMLRGQLGVDKIQIIPAHDSNLVLELLLARSIIYPTATFFLRPCWEIKDSIFPFWNGHLFVTRG